jgi:alpha-L-glutamate ligase-like protein
MMGLFALTRRLHASGVLGVNGRNADYTLIYNRRDRYPLVDDKVQTKKLAAAAGIAVPELYGLVEIQHQARVMPRLLEKHWDFVIKPARGSQGEGIIVVTGRSRRHYRTADGSFLDDEDLYFHVSNILSGVYSLG